MVGITSAAQGQVENIPNVAYLSAFRSFNNGDFAEAIKEFEEGGRGAIKGANGRWIDSICHHAMTGECYYQVGNYPKALEHFRSALLQYLQFPNWMIRVQWPASLGPASAAKVRITWGRTKRAAKPGNFPDSFPITLGGFTPVPGTNIALSNAKTVPIDAVEIIRCTALAIRRYGELLGPSARFDDAVLGKVITELNARPVAPNHWSQTWVDVLLGCAYRAAGKAGDAQTYLKRGIVAAGEYDHPLTCFVLLELGHMALATGDFAGAANLFEEATYAAAWYEAPGGPAATQIFTSSRVIGQMEEAFHFGLISHLLSNKKEPYPLLTGALGWAKQKKYHFLTASLTLSAAESAVHFNQNRQAMSAIAAARGIITKEKMSRSRIEARLNHVAAMALYQQGNVDKGDEALRAAMAFQKNGGSVWMFQISIADNLYTSATLTPRQAKSLFEFVLRDPGRYEWLVTPLEALSVLATPHVLPYEHWFDLLFNGQDRDLEQALEVADLIRRHRFFSTLDFGGRVEGLRWLLESPQNTLNQDQALQKRDILLQYPAYDQLTQQVKKLQGELAKLPLVNEANDPQQRAQADKLNELAKLSLAQEALLRQIGVRREHASLMFPPLRSTKEIQKALPPGHFVLAFFASSLPLKEGREEKRRTYAFLFGQDKDRYSAWPVERPEMLTTQIKTLLRETGNYENNRELPVAEIKNESWKATAALLYDEIFKGVKDKLPADLQELIVVPDGSLWYLPFEMLQIPSANGHAESLLATTRLRCVPFASMAAPDSRGRKPSAHVGVALGRLFPRQGPEVAQDAFQELTRVVPTAVALPKLLPGPSSIYATLFDGLVVYDDIPPPEANPYQWSPVPLDSSPQGTLDRWMSLPWGGPDHLILPGYHTPAENSLKDKSGGSEVFLSVCGLMACGSRTILMSRWRTGGKTSFDLTREFAQELPNVMASQAWQRSVFVTLDTPLDPSREPRLNVQPKDDLPKATHPFFWAGYLLVDTGAAPVKEDENAAAREIGRP
jgi:tetratricopeptide (TPR) repeat protein